ncbi:hypothetical protein PTKIN_Ptkin10aG0072500 [Pterospermum kingtungense]
MGFAAVKWERNRSKRLDEKGEKKGRHEGGRFAASLAESTMNRSGSGLRAIARRLGDVYISGGVTVPTLDKDILEDFQPKKIGERPSNRWRPICCFNLMLGYSAGALI